MQGGDPTQYILHFPSVAKQGMIAVGLARESTQSNASHLVEQVEAIQKGCERRGLKLAGVIRHVGPGYGLGELDLGRRSWSDALLEARRLARECGADLIVATEADRLVSNQFCASPTQQRRSGQKWERPQATKAELEQLRMFTGGVILATLAPPDAPPSEAISVRTKRGQGKPGGSKGGRPAKPGYKKRRRLRLQSRARRLRGAGASWREIARRLNVKPSTVRDWLRRPK